MKPHHAVYCRIVLTHGGKCFWTTKILLVCGDIILYGACLVHYAFKKYELLGWKIHERESPTNSDDSTVHVFNLVN